MFTTIGICLVGLVGLIFCLSQAYVGTPAGTITIIKNYGGKAVKCLTPGIGWMLWPYEGILTRLKVETITQNISVRANCLLNALAEGDSPDFSKHGLIEVECAEVSFHFRLAVDKLKNPDHLFQVITLNEDGQIGYGKIIELIKDKIQTTLKSLLENIGLMEASLSQDKMEKRATTAIKTMIEDEDLPIDFGKVIINRAFRPTDPELIKALDDKTKAALARSAAEQEMDLEVFQSEKKVAIARNEAAAQAARIQGTLDAFGTNLPPGKKQELFLQLQAMETLKVMPGTKLLLSGSLLTEAKNLVAQFTGGK